MNKAVKSRGRPDARQKILASAEAIARESGPANLSLDAVAERAGVSKGGLLYHFPSKAKLLEAVVEEFLEAFNEALLERERKAADAANVVVQAYLDLFLEERCRKKPPPAGLLAALAEDPSFVEPVRRYERMFLDRMKERSDDPTIAMMVFLVIQGIRSMELLNLSVMQDNEIESVVDRLRLTIGSVA